MKVMYKIISAVTFSLMALVLPFQISAAEILGGGGNAAEKLILDWANYKQGDRNNTIKFSASIPSNDLAMLQSGKIDFAILDTSLNEAELAKMNLLQIPFALNGISIVVNLQNTMAGTLRLDGQTLGKIFSGEISNWDDPAIAALNPKHTLPNNPITVIHSGELSTDYSVVNSYFRNINETWKSGDLNGKKREWPANSIFADGFSNRISILKRTPFSIGYLPMQYMPQPSLSGVHLKNRDGNFVGLSDISIKASASGSNIDDGQSASLSLINKGGNASWPISTFSFIVVHKDRIKEEKIAQFLSVIGNGLKFGTLKPTVHNYVAIPDQISKSIIAKIESRTASSSPAAVEKTASVKVQDNTQEENRKTEDKIKANKSQSDELAREQAIREARATKLAAEEAVRAANAAKIQAEQLAERNRLIAKAEKDRADKEKAEKEQAQRELAEKERAQREKAEQERAIQLRNQKDEDPLETYRRSVGK